MDAEIPQKPFSSTFPQVTMIINNPSHPHPSWIQQKKLWEAEFVGAAVRWGRTQDSCGWEWELWAQSDRGDKRMPFLPCCCQDNANIVGPNHKPIPEYIPEWDNPANPNSPFAFNSSLSYPDKKKKKSKLFSCVSLVLSKQWWPLSFCCAVRVCWGSGSEALTVGMSDTPAPPRAPAPVLDLKGTSWISFTSASLEMNWIFSPEQSFGCVRF